MFLIWTIAIVKRECKLAEINCVPEPRGLAPGGSFFCPGELEVRAVNTGRSRSTGLLAPRPGPVSESAQILGGGDFLVKLPKPGNLRPWQGRRSGIREDRQEVSIAPISGRKVEDTGPEEIVVVVSRNMDRGIKKRTPYGIA
jgi:hypothetical protein